MRAGWLDLRNWQQITFVMLNRFCLLSKPSTSDDVNIRLDLLGKFPALKSCQGGHSFFLLLSQTPLYISFNWSILVLIIIIYSTCRESRGFYAALFVKTQINFKCKVVYEAKENFVKNFWLNLVRPILVFFGTDMHQSIMNQIQSNVSLYSQLRLTRMNFSGTMSSVAVFTWLQQE